MSTPARKSGRQAKPTEKFKEYLYEREVPSKIEHTSSITEHIQASKEKPSTDATIHTTLKKRGRPRKSVLEVDPLKNKTNNPEIEDEDKDNDTKGSENKKGPHKEANFEPQFECNSSTMTDTDSEGEDHGRKSPESGPRRSGRPPKLNKRLLSYLHSEEDKLIKRNNQDFKILPVARKVTSVYDFIPSPPKTSKKGFDKENKKHTNIESEPRRSIRTPKTNARLLNFLNSEVTPKRQTSLSDTRENSMNTNELSNIGHAAPKKSDQKMFEDITSGEASSPEPRRSSRVPKMNERLLSYLNREEGTIISLLFPEKQSSAKGSAELPSDLNSSPRSSTNGNFTNGSSGSNSIQPISPDKSEKPVCELEPRRSSREPKTSEKLYNYLNSVEGKYRKLPVKSHTSSSILTQQSSFQRINAEMKISPIGDLSPRRSSRAPKTNERLLNYLYAGDRKIKRSSEVSGTDSQTSPIITVENEKVKNSKSSNSTNEEKYSEEDCPIKEPRRSNRTPKTNEKLRNYLQPKEVIQEKKTTNQDGKSNSKVTSVTCAKRKNSRTEIISKQCKKTNTVTDLMKDVRVMVSKVKKGSSTSTMKRAQREI